MRKQFEYAIAQRPSQVPPRAPRREKIVPQPAIRGQGSQLAFPASAWRALYGGGEFFALVSSQAPAMSVVWNLWSEENCIGMSRDTLIELLNTAVQPTRSRAPANPLVTTMEALDHSEKASTRSEESIGKPQTRFQRHFARVTFFLTRWGVETNG